ncbi:MAG: hypothetical protein J5556_01580, partial [Deltaproteobacteria bacterium]|nr:hypothetical protein [Deltaproteobacteria bacterium]
MKYCKCKEKRTLALRLCAAFMLLILYGCSRHTAQVADVDKATQWWPAGYEYIPEEPAELAEGGLTETDLLDTDPDPSQAASRAR